MKKIVNDYKRILLPLFGLIVLFSLIKVGLQLSSRVGFELTNVTVNDKSSNLFVVVNSYEDNTIKTEVTFDELNDYAKYILTIKNNTTKDIKIKSIKDNNNNQYIINDYSFGKDLIKDGESFDIMMKTSYLNDLDKVEDTLQKEEYKITVNLLDEDGNEITEEINVNPLTLNNTLIYIVMGSIALALIIIILLIDYVEENKLLLGIVILLPLLTFVIAKLNVLPKVTDGLTIDVKVLWSMPYEGAPEKKDNPPVPVDPEPDTKEDDKKEETPKVTPVEFNISYDLDGGIAVGNPFQYNVETDTFTLVNPTKQGYTFIGWTGSNGDVPQLVVTITKGSSGIKKYKANFTINSYNVVFNTNGGSSIDPASIVYNTQLGDLPVPTFTGHTLEGWYSDSNFNNRVSSDTRVYDEMNLYAKWNANPYSIVFDGNGNTSGTTSEVNCTYDINCTLTTNGYTKDGHTFAGWSDTSDGNVLYLDGSEVSNLVESGTKTLYAKWNKNNYEVKFNSNGGSSIDPIRRDYEEELGTLPVPTFAGHTLEGWYSDTLLQNKVSSTTKVYEDMELVANWDINTYRIEFNGNGNTGGSTDYVDCTYGLDCTLTLNGFTKTGHSFAGWAESADGEVVYQDNVNVANLVESGTKTLYAKWTANPYTIVFNGNGNTSGETSNANCTYGTSCTLTTNGYVKEGHTFAGWAANSTGEVVYTDGASVTNLVESGTTNLYAKWNINTYRVTFDSNGGTEAGYVDRTYNTAVGTLPTPTNGNQILVGWFTKAEGGDQISSSTLVTKNITYYAHWEENPIICKKATVLHTATCDSTGACATVGYTDTGIKGTTTITYGNIPSDALQVGDAYDCDVNKDGTYDPVKERFYYLYTDNNKASLIYYSGFEDDEPKNELIFPYEEARGKLPSTSLWKNVKNTYADDKAARFADKTKLVEACANGTNGTNVGDLDSCEFLYEGTKFENTSTGRSAFWLEQENSSCSRVFSPSRRTEAKSCTGSSNAARPVIEVDLVNMDSASIVKFNSNGGTSVPALRVEKNSTIENLPSTTRDGYLLDGWYTAITGGEKVNNGVTVSASVEYFARWKGTVSLAEIENDNLQVAAGNTVPINITNKNIIDEELLFESSDNSIATVNENGVITGVAPGTTTITITGKESQVVRNVDITVNANVTKYNVTFITNGGTSVEPIEVEENKPIGELPNSTKDEYVLDGWYIDETLTNEVYSTTVVTGDLELYARWRPTNAVARVNGEYFNTLKAAFAAVPKTNTPTDVVVLQDILTDTTATSAKQTIINLKTGNHTVAYNGTAQLIEVSGIVNITDGTYTTTAESGMINILKGGTLNISGGNFSAIDGKQVLYNNGGTVVIEGDAYLTSSSNIRATVHNLNNGTMYIKGGTIISTGTSEETDVATPNGVRNESGIVYIGVEGGELNTTNPIIEGSRYGVLGTNIYFYDGIIKGKVDAFSDVPTDSYLEAETSIVYGTSEDYKTAILNSNQYVITLNAKGGSVSPSSITIDKGESITTLPDAHKDNYTFDGWFTEENGGVEVTLPITPSSNVEYFAHYTYIANNDVVAFNMMNDAMSEYYQKIGTWKGNQSTFQTNMNNNFNKYNCKCNENTCNTSGTVLCDKPKGYDTGVGSEVKVYLSDENTKTKGNLVTYTTSSNGVIYNMIPGTTYYWESVNDPSVHGLVKASGERRIINIDGVRNVRDLGGLEVDYNDDGVIDGTLKYGKLFRGEKLWNSDNNVLQLKKLGINEEVDLRAASERVSGEVKFTSPDIFKQKEIKHYQLNYTTQRNNYDITREALVEVMQDIIDGKVIYFHCRIGTDRTGTLAYLLEGLLGVKQEQMLEDYELSYFFGLVNRHRFYAEDPNSSVSKDQKFVYMYDIMSDHNGVYEWFMLGSTNEEADKELIRQFREAMVE